MKKIWKKISRIHMLSVFFLMLFGILVQRLWVLQIAGGEKYTRNFNLKVTKTIREKGTRGTIYDCNGKILAENRSVHVLTMSDDQTYDSSRVRHLSLNSTIYHVLKCLYENGESVNNELKIKINASGKYEYTVEGTALKRFRADVFGKADPEDMTEEQAQMTAEELVSWMAGAKCYAIYEDKNGTYSKEELEKYQLKDHYSDQELLDIIGIRYMLSLKAYRKYESITVARDISEKTVAFILENRSFFSGIFIEEDWERVYHGGEALSHVIGYTGNISQEELAKRQKEGETENYSSDSIVGKTGIEWFMEEELRGVDGETQISVDNVGRQVGNAAQLKQTVKGNDVYLTIDMDLQEKVYGILEKNIAKILADNLINANEFDRTKIQDGSDVRIAIGEVYIAFVENDILNLEHLQEKDATELEKAIAKKAEKKKEEALKSLEEDLTDGEKIYDNLSKEMKSYENFLVEESGILKNEQMDQNDSAYTEWKEGGISTKDFLHSCIVKGWIDLSSEESSLGEIEESRNEFEENYMTSEESMEVLIRIIKGRLKDNSNFEKLLFRYLIIDGEVSGKEICRLLYDQKILTKKGADYKALMDGTMDSFTFMKKKILNVEITPAQLALDPCSASAVVLEEKTGKVLACVSYPGYDCNRLVSETDGEYYSQLLRDKSLPLYNRATQQNTAPGSTLKPLTIIAGLEEKVITPDTSIYCNGIFDKVKPSLRCWNHAGHGEVKNAASAIKNSCNDYLCDISYRLGTKNSREYDDKKALYYLQKYASLFDLDKKSGLELTESDPHVTDAYGIPSAIGQGTHNYTTVQLARYVNTLAARGDSFSLSLIERVRREDGTVIEKEPELESRVELSDIVWDTVQKGMEQFAESNSDLKDMKVKVAGKTGTAQESKTRPDHALFVGYAPADDPKITMAVRIANGYASSNATKIAREILESLTWF